MCTSSGVQTLSKKHDSTAADQPHAACDVVRSWSQSRFTLHLPANNRVENYAAKCTRTPAKAEDKDPVKILLTGISNFYGRSFMSRRVLCLQPWPPSRSEERRVGK